MLSKKIFTVATIASTLTLGSIVSAQASMVTGTILADNGSIAVHEQNGTFKVIQDSVAGNWPKLKTFSVDIPDDERSLSQCKLHVISWGDGAVAQGTMAHFAGTGGIAYTGQNGSPLNNVSMSSKTHSGGTAAGQTFATANAQSIITSPRSGNTVFVSQPVISGGIPGTWGPINLPANMQERGNVKFIWNEKSNSLNANPNNYRVLSMPCSTVVKPEPEKPQAQSLASWEIAGQFNATKNPYEVWTYGYINEPDCKGTMIPFKNKTSNSFMNRSIDQWQRGTTLDANDLPMVGQSKGDTLLAPLKWSPNGISMHPGPQGQCAVVRFTAPAAGNYRFMGRFWAQNVSSSGTDTDVTVAINNLGTPSNIKALGGAPTNKPFMATGISLKVGDTIDFKVGANGNFINDSTGLHGYIQRDEN
jgi:hypothetical protein